VIRGPPEPHLGKYEEGKKEGEGGWGGEGGFLWALPGRVSVERCAALDRKKASHIRSVVLRLVTGAERWAPPI